MQDILIKEAERDRKALKYAYFITLIASNILYHNILGLPPIYSPLQVLLPFEHSPILLLLLALYIDAGFVVLNTFTFGVLGILVSISIPLHVTPLSMIFRDPGVFFINIMAALMMLLSTFTFDDALWIYYGRKLNRGRTWRTLLKYHLKWRFFYLPALLFLFILFDYLDMRYIPRADNTAALLIPILLIISYSELAFMGTGRIKTMQKTKVAVLLLIFVPALVLSYLSLTYPGLEYAAGLLLIPIVAKVSPKIYDRIERLRVGVGEQ